MPLSKEPTKTLLGRDPPRQERLNGVSYQQNAIISHKGWQYAVFYTSKSIEDPQGPLLVSLSRRRKVVDTAAVWETLTLPDYEQVVDDSHNTISLGICPGDGTIHLSFDHHADRLRFRRSVKGLTEIPESFHWDAALFGPTSHSLPGINESYTFDEVTYPRFLSVGNDLILTHRMGRAGLGSEALYYYSSSTHEYYFRGVYLTGTNNNPYINGIDYRHGRLHLSWTYRGFVEYEGARDPDSSTHKAPSGPNGSENNYDVAYTYSENAGKSWYNSAGQEIANMSFGETVLPTSNGIIVFEIPKHSGITNQEGQTTDLDGGFHILNRENTSGDEQWKHYYRSPSGKWLARALPGIYPKINGLRGKMVVDRQNNLYFVLPGNHDYTLTLARSTRSSGYQDFEIVWKGTGYCAEPLIDIQGIEDENILSVFTISHEQDGKRHVLVLDFAVE